MFDAVDEIAKPADKSPFIKAYRDFAQNADAELFFIAPSDGSSPDDRQICQLTHNSQSIYDTWIYDFEPQARFLRDDYWRSESIEDLAEIGEELAVRGAVAINPDQLGIWAAAFSPAEPSIPTQITSTPLPVEAALTGSQLSKLLLEGLTNFLQRQLPQDKEFVEYRGKGWAAQDPIVKFMNQKNCALAFVPNQAVFHWIPGLVLPDGWHTGNLESFIVVEPEKMVGEAEIFDFLTVLAERCKAAYSDFLKSATTRRYSNVAGSEEMFNQTFLNFEIRTRIAKALGEANICIALVPLEGQTLASLPGH